MAIEDRVGYLSRDQFVSDIKGSVATSLTGTFQPLNATLTTLSSRAIGAASATDIIDRAAGDIRYALASASVSSFNTRTGAVTLTSSDVTTALAYTPTSVTGLTGVQTVAAFKTGLTLVKADVGLGSVDNTADSAKSVLSATKLTTSRTIAGNSFDGSANITINDTDLSGSAWTAYTPTVTPSTGTFTTVSTSGRYKKIGKTVYFSLRVLITTNGTAGGAHIDTTAPVASVNSGYGHVFIGVEEQVTGSAFRGYLLPNATTIRLANFDGATYPGASGYSLAVSGTYEAA